MGMKAGERQGLKPSPRFIQIVEKFFQYYRRMIKHWRSGEGNMQLLLKRKKEDEKVCCLWTLLGCQNMRSSPNLKEIFALSSGCCHLCLLSFERNFRRSRH